MLEEIIIFNFSFFIIKRALLDFFLIMKVAYAYLQCLYYENSSAIDQYTNNRGLNKQYQVKNVKEQNMKLSKFKISEQENIFYRNICKLKRFTSNALELLSVGGGLGDLSGKCG